MCRNEVIQMRAIVLATLFVLACAPTQSASLPSASSSARATASASPSPSATVSATASASAAVSLPTVAAATSRPASPTAAATTSATSAPSTQRCESLSGGSQNTNRVLSDVRAARQPGFDRVVFDFGAGALPPYVIEQVDRVIQGASGAVVPVDGNVFISVRFPQAGEQGSYRGATRVRPDTTNVREVVISTNFEGVLAFGIGLSHQACPKVSVLSSPARLLLDFYD